MTRIALLTALLAAASPAAAQGTTPRAGTEHEAVQVVRRMFDAMRARDTAAMRAVFDTNAVLISTANRQGAPVVGYTRIGNFIEGITRAPAGQLLDERIYAPEVRASDNLATVWTEYDFYLGSNFSHCGVDAFMLAKTDAGWKIVSLADTRRREGCPQRAK